MASLVNGRAIAPLEQCSATMFDERTGIFSDSCVEKDRDRQGVESLQYRMHNYRNVAVCGRDILAMATCHPNLRFKNGLGNVDACNVDDDTRVRISAPESTNPRHRQQLSVRVAHAGPCLARGEPDLAAESSLIHAENSLRARPCSVLTGASTDVFVPLLPCVKSAQAVEHVVPDWTAVDTRAWVRSSAYARRCARR